MGEERSERGSYDADLLIAKVNNGDGDLITERDVDAYKSRYVASNANIIVMTILMLMVLLMLLVFLQLNRKSFASFDSGVERVLCNEPGVSPVYASSLIYLTPSEQFVNSEGGKKELSQALLDGRSLMLSMYGSSYEKPEYSSARRYDLFYKPGLVHMPPAPVPPT